MKQFKKDPFFDFGYNPRVSCDVNQAGALHTEYNCVPLDLDSPLENIHENIQCLASWIERFLKENLSQGFTPVAFYPFGLIAGVCRTNPRGNSIVQLIEEPSKGFSARKQSTRWGTSHIAIHGLISEVVYDCYSPGSFIANQCLYFPRFSNAKNPEHAKSMERQLDLRLA